MKTRLASLAMLALAACTAGETAAEQPQTSQFEQELQALSEPGRNLAFRNAIRDSGATCDRVEQSQFQETFNRTGMWVAQCTDSGNFAIFVTQQGFAQVVRCQDLASTDAPACKPLSGDANQD